MADNARAFYALRPNATFKGGEVNYFSYDTIKETYLGTMPTRDAFNSQVALTAIEGKRTSKIAELREEADRRFRLINDELSLPHAGWSRQIVLTIIAAARTPTADVTKANNTWTAGINARNFLLTATEAQIDAYNVVTGPAWP